MGTISESIVNLSSLAVFQIEDNLFEGALPTGLASLEELRKCAEETCIRVAHVAPVAPVDVVKLSPYSLIYSIF